MQVSPSRSKKKDQLIDIFITYEDTLQITYPLNPSLTLEQILWDLALNHLPIEVGALSKALKQGNDTICSLYALRYFESLELVTEDQIREGKISYRAHVRLCPGPKPLAQSMLVKLGDVSNIPLAKRNLFELKAYILEKDFVHEFIAANGFQRLLDLLINASNELSSYVLRSVSILVERESTLISSISGDHLNSILACIAPETPTDQAILAINLVMKYTTFLSNSKDDSLENQKFTFYDAILKQPFVIKTIVVHLTSFKPEFQQTSLKLINTLIHSTPQSMRPELMRKLDSFGVRRAVASLNCFRNDSSFGDLLLKFQDVIMHDYRQGSQVTVDMNVFVHGSALSDLWEMSQLENRDEERNWTRLGFMNARPDIELQRIGVLGLASIHFFAKRNQQLYIELIKEAEQDPINACPFASAGILTCRVLLDAWGITRVESPDPKSRRFLPFFLLFEDTFGIVFKAFLSLWKGMSAQKSQEDMIKVERLLAFHVNAVLAELEEMDTADLGVLYKIMVDVPFAQVRDSFLRERVLDQRSRGVNQLSRMMPRISEISFHFMTEQRISCLLEGAWFDLPPSKAKDPSHRFCRLSQDRSKLLYDDFAHSVSQSLRSDLELSKSILISDVADIVKIEGKILSFTLKHQSNAPLLDLHCRSQIQLSEWIDGIRLLKNQNSSLTPITSKLIDSVIYKNLVVSAQHLVNNYLLTDEEPPEIPPLPKNFDFWFKDKCFDPVLNLEVVGK